MTEAKAPTEYKLLVLECSDIMRIILNFLGLKHISKSFRICKYWQSNSTRCLADFNTQVIIKVDDFEQTPENLVGFINWMTERISESNQIKSGYASTDQELFSNIKSIQINLKLSKGMWDFFKNEFIA